MTLKAFDTYTKHGLKVLPLLPFSKKPFLENWQDISLYDSAKYRSLMASDVNYNLGLILGDIVDVEGDSEEANGILDDLIGDVPHPRYRSSKSTHHLFLTPDPKLTRFSVGKIEFRGRNHQSALPPSRHEDGTHYAWLPGSRLPVPVMPNRLTKFYWANRGRPDLKPDHVELICPSCNKKVGVHKKRLAAERKVCSTINLMWECNKCRDYDLRATVRHLKRKSR